MDVFCLNVTLFYICSTNTFNVKTTVGIHLFNSSMSSLRAILLLADKELYA